MDSRLMEAKLVNHQIFKDVKESLKENPGGKLRNLMDLRDDVLYLWNSIEACLFSLNLKRLEEHDEETPYQKLHLLNPPSFPVERVVTSSCGSRVCLWGSRGVTVAELPTRWGRGGLFDSGSKTVLCKSHSLDERFLYSQAEVRRAGWHPTSLSHLFVLVSDNTIRLYNIALKSGPKLVKIYTIGAKPSSLLAGRTILDSLGDTAVDFTATPGGEALLILRGNGDVYMMQCDLDSKTPQQNKLSGPLAMYPPADDNYGADSCSILAIGSPDLPSVVVVATCSAVLHHCLLLPNSPDKPDDDTHALYVVETVELNINLASEDADMQYSYPVHLYQCTSATYACMHATGVHAVTLPILRHLKDFALADDVEIDPVLSTVSSSRGAVRWLLSAAPPPAALAPSGHTLMLLLQGALIFRSIEPYDLEEQLYKELQLRNPTLEQDEINNILKERQKLSFTSIIQDILSREASQPILNLNKKEEPTPKECLETLSSATLRLRGEYISRQKCAAAALTRKVAALQAMGGQHERWFKELQNEIEELQRRSDALREKCALAEKRQDDMKYRCSAVIRRFRASTSACPAERALLHELEQYKRNSERAAERIAVLTEHAHRKSNELKKWQEEYKKKDIALGKSHSDTISSILQQQTSQISTLIEETKLLKDQLSIV